eukprot:10743_1
MSIKPRRNRRKRRRTSKINQKTTNDDQHFESPPKSKRRRVTVVLPMIDNMINNVIQTKKRERANGILLSLLFKSNQYEMHKKELMKQLKWRDEFQDDLGEIADFIEKNNDDFYIFNTKTRNWRVTRSQNHLPPKPAKKQKQIEAKQCVFSSLDEVSVSERIIDKEQTECLVLAFCKGQSPYNIPIALTPFTCRVSLMDDIFIVFGIYCHETKTFHKNTKTVSELSWSTQCSWNPMHLLRSHFH